MTDAAMTTQMTSGQGFIAALDQSGGSTPKALRLYGVEEDEYGSDAEMFAEIQKMRERIILAPDFTSEKVIGAILFERTLDEVIDGKPVAEYLWSEKRIVPFLKIDKGLEDTTNGCQLIKPIPGLDDLLSRAVAHGIFGTKERSVINAANPIGIAANVAQQFDLAHQVLAHGLMPIIEPEVTISIADKAAAEDILMAEILKNLDGVPEGQQVMLKLTLPTKAGLYAPLIAHPKVMRVVALSGGYARDEANAKLAENAGMIASFSRALTEGLSAHQSDEAFNATIAEAIEGIYQASIT